MGQLLLSLYVLANKMTRLHCLDVIFIRTTSTYYIALLQQFHKIHDPPTQKFAEVMFVFDIRVWLPTSILYYIS